MSESAQTAAEVLDQLDAAKDLARLEELDRECREASADAERQTAGMREVALFRAANAKAVMGSYSLGLAKRNGKLVAALRAVQKIVDDWQGWPGEHLPSADLLVELRSAVAAALTDGTPR